MSFDIFETPTPKDSYDEAYNNSKDGNIITDLGRIFDGVGMNRSDAEQREHDLGYEHGKRDRDSDSDSNYNPPRSRD